MSYYYDEIDERESDRTFKEWFGKINKRLE